MRAYLTRPYNTSSTVRPAVRPSARGLLVLAACAMLACSGTGGGTGGTGGAPATGTGGNQNGTGGASTAGTGGTVGTGGASTTGTGGGSSSTGGGTGTGGANTGGRVSTGGGSGGETATGGATGTGGMTTATGGATGAGGADACPGAAYDASSPPQALTLSGNLGAHDPAALVVGSEIYLYATGLIAKTSTNLTSWTAQSNPLNPRPSWIATSVPGATNLWAPDISNFGGVYHLYYAASTFGSNSSCIGQATRASLTTGSWADQGSVICSNVGHTGDNWNAIDPNVVIDDAGTPWLVFGSFWGGIKIIQLTTDGARADSGTPMGIAARPSNGGALEGAWVFKRCGYYYLFTSWGSCCSSPYDYNIRVGRSTSVTGPYADKAGTQLMSGGGTLVVQGNSSWVAPGHNAVITYNNKTYNIYHALQGSSSGPATLRISEIAWDPDGWPISGGP